MADMRKLDDRALTREVAKQRKLVDTLAATDLSYQELRLGKGDEVLSQMQAAGDAMVAARAELGRREHQRTHQPQREMHSRKVAAMDAWAMQPGRTQRRRGKELPFEEASKAFWLYQGSVPPPLQYDQLDERRLTEQEGAELHGLALRARKGTLDASEVPRIDALLEKAAGQEPGAVEANQKLLAQQRSREEERDAVLREAERQSEFDRERRMAAMGVPRR